MTQCTCWIDYPNKNHLKKNGKWKCVDCYVNIRERKGNRIKTKCEKVIKPDEE